MVYLLPVSFLWLHTTVSIDPLNLWSLWVPFCLLLLIVLAAIYFVRVSIR